VAFVKWLKVGLFGLAAILAGLFFGYLSRSGGGSATPLQLKQRALYVVTKNHTYELTVEVATTPAEQERGLMFRTQMDPDHGMIFIFPHATDGGFWMKNTKIPLSIAFFDRNGVILRILQMEPCRLPEDESDRCPVYYPGVAYVGALEVNKGWFAEHGVKEGDSISLGPWKR
jgi:uncharacterized membrane protein (UPF0127 family)